MSTKTDTYPDRQTDRLDGRTEKAPQTVSKTDRQTDR